MWMRPATVSPPNYERCLCTKSWLLISVALLRQPKPPTELATISFGPTVSDKKAPKEIAHKRPSGNTEVAVKVVLYA